MKLRLLLVLIGTLPLWSFVPNDTTLLGPIARSVSALLGSVCQQDLSRALPIFEASLPCARCSGLYFGVGLGAWLPRPTLSSGRLWTWFGFGLAIIALDVATEVLRMRPASAWMRLLTGIILAYPASLLAISNGRDARRSVAARLDPKANWPTFLTTRRR